jgi:branched-chain amino acid transport system ATP-binding protein
MSGALHVDGLVAGYEPGLDIVKGVSLPVATGSVVALLGPNGAGKSTLLKAIAGLVPVRAGRIVLGDRDLTALPVHARTAAGLAFVPQTDNVFATLSVEENLQIAAVGLPRAQRRARIESVTDRFPDLATARRKLAGRLSGGQRQMLALARALVVAPAVLLVDEPTAGLSPRMVETVGAILREIAGSGPGVLLVEQNVDAALRIADRAVVLVDGRIARAAKAAELRDDPGLGALFLGQRDEAA